MSKKVNIKKVARTLRLAENEFRPAKYWVYEVKISPTVSKRFASRPDAKAWVANHTKMAKLYFTAKRAVAAK